MGAKQMNKMEKGRVGQQLRREMSPEKVKDDELVLVTYASDISRVPAQKPSFVVFPESRDDVVAVLRTANEHKIPVTVMSGGVNVVGACIPVKDGIVIDLRRMDRIMEINTDSG